MQKMVIVGVLVIMLVSGSVLALSVKKQFSADNNDTPVVQDSPTTTAMPEITQQAPSASPQPTQKPKAQPTTVSRSNLQRFVYPGSRIVNSTPTSVSLESGDDTMQIITWYKEVMQQENAQIKNTVVNTVNGKTTATMTVSTDGQNLYVTITHSEALTSIKLEEK
jgi:hypothetical protein